MEPNVGVEDSNQAEVQQEQAATVSSMVGGAPLQSVSSSTQSNPELDKRFTGATLDEIMVLEIFAGTARLTRAIKDLGMSAMAVDKDNQRAQSVHIAKHDLNEPDQVQSLCDFIQRHHKQILWAHFAPSCGTASRARGRPLPKLAKLGVKVPMPLRSDTKPMGLDGLGGLDKVKAETANITYDNACLLMRFCINLNIAVSLENPENSLFWKVPTVKAFMEDVGGFMVYFDNCCHGGTRKKGTAWWSNVNWFMALAIRCDGSHFHEKWNAELVDGKVVFSDPFGSSIPHTVVQQVGFHCQNQSDGNGCD